MNELNEPLRLLRKRGSWTLEVTKLVAVDEHVLRPERRRVNGTDSVVRHLKERCAPSLVREALDLLIGDDDGSDRAFELEGEHWVMLAEDAPTDAGGASTATLLAMIGELRVELTTMRALHEAMRGRLAAVERRSLQMSSADHGRSALRGASRREHAPGSLRPGARARSLAPGEEPALAAPAVVAPTPQPAAPTLGEDRTQAVGAPPALPEALAPVGAPAKPGLAMPTQPDIASCLKQLLGVDAELRAERGNVPKDLDGFYVSRIVDSSDQEVGAILLDLRGGVELGGRLMGFPAAAIEEQAKSEPSSDIMDAMNEVTNNLGGFVNRANPDLRVRVRPLEKFSVAEFGWLPKNTARIGNTTKTGGRLWLAAR
ncbi:MAG TPA: hypothetical protein VHP33_20930 [Polyangiaceae bacterium]|nr:hypothetical protein [Polyangiaceae bacterium]